MELKIEQMQLPQQIKWNYEELKTQLATRLHDYSSLVYTEDTVKEAKTDRAGLNKLKSALNDERIRLEKEYTAPFATFKSQVKELCDMIDSTSKSIGIQIEDFEAKKKEQKREQIVGLFNEVFAQDMPWLGMELLFDEKWLNASVSLKSIKTSLEEEKTAITEELNILGRLKEFSLEATAVYKKTLSLAKAQQEADHLLEVEQLRKEQQLKEQQALEVEKRVLEEEVNNSSPTPEKAEIRANEPIVDTDNEQNRQWLAFKVWVTPDEAKWLASYLKVNGVKFDRV